MTAAVFTPLISLSGVNKHFGDLHVLRDVDHEMGFARSAANRVVFMADGRIVEDRAPEDFFARPESDRARDFLSKILKH